MASKLDICNAALAVLSQLPIADIDDDTDTNAVYCKSFWDLARDAMLQEHPWGFATRRRSLQQTTAPVYGYTYAYGLPADCLQVWDVYPDSDWEREDQAIVSDQEELSIRYTYRVEETGKWSSAFCDAFAFNLVTRIVGSIKGKVSAAEMERHFAVYDKRLTIAKARDVRERKVTETDESDWLGGRT